MTTATTRSRGWFAIGLGRWNIETRRFLRQRESVVFTIGLPVLLLCIFGAVFNEPIEGTHPPVPFSQYFAAGMIASGLLNSGFQALAIGICIERDNGGLKRLAGSPMPRASYFVGKFLLVATISALQIALLIGVGVAFFGLDWPTPYGWFTFAWLWLLGGATCALLGIAFSSVPRDGESAPALLAPIVLVLQFISGVFFLYSQLPTWMQKIAAIFPLKWLTQGMRSVFLPESFQTQEVSGSWQLPLVFLVLVIWAVIGVVLCLRTFRWQRRGET
jgi:ABC-2 type transport system permease protein